MIDCFLRMKLSADQFCQRKVFPENTFMLCPSPPFEDLLVASSREKGCRILHLYFLDFLGECYLADDNESM